MDMRENIGKKRLGGRLAALVLCTLFLATAIVPTLFLLIHANHTHDHNGSGDTCAVCTQLRSAEDSLRRVAAAVMTAAIMAGGLFGVLFLLKAATAHCGVSTLVSLKVRLNP